MKKYKLYMELEREGMILRINDLVKVKENEHFDITNYLFSHDLEHHTLIKFELKEIEG